jgi:hypothetical protein
LRGLHGLINDFSGVMRNEKLIANLAEQLRRVWIAKRMGRQELHLVGILRSTQPHRATLHRV